MADMLPEVPSMTSVRRTSTRVDGRREVDDEFTAATAQLLGT